jgi:NAD+ diphosphatase
VATDQQQTEESDESGETLADGARFVPGVEAPLAAEGERGWWFAFRDGDLLVGPAGNDLAPPLATTFADLGFAPDVEEPERQFLGLADGVACWSLPVTAETEPPPGWKFVGLRGLFGRMPDPLYAVAGRAAQIVAWRRDHRFCGRCGTATEAVSGERARRCPACGLTAYPRVSPAVIVLVEKDDRILLARGHAFPAGRFGIVAGFVEAGESLEDAVHRELAEEVGIRVTELAYFSSQPWPFPHNLMVGFRARWLSGEIAIDPSELAEAGWFGLDDLPTIPQKLSIARRLIDDWAARRGAVIPDETAW